MVVGKLISLEDAAETYGVSTRTLRRYISDGRITGYRVGPKLIRVDPEELKTAFRIIPTANWGER